MRWTRTAAVFVLGIVVVAAAAAPAFAQRGPYSAVAQLTTADGAAAGRVDLLGLDGLLGSDSGSGGGSVEFAEPALTGRGLAGLPQGVIVLAQLRGLPPGFHGFHVHETGRCDGPSFTSAGGHFDAVGASHPNHAGDMPVVHVSGDGTATAAFVTDRFTVRRLFDVDGSAIVVHADPDNYANIPTDRYDPDPDASTRATGDAGDPIACGVVSRGRFAEGEGGDEGRTVAAARILRRDGSSAGEAAFGRAGGKTFVAAFLYRIPVGFHGFHVHETGRCDRPSFASAGGHLNPTGVGHGGHAGDLPVAYVTGARVGVAVFDTDRLRIRDLLDGDGSAIVVHADADNYANIPIDRYDPNPDAITLSTGDAGDRIACGVVRRVVRCTISVSPSRFRAGERAILRARVRSGGRPLRDTVVFAHGPGFAAGAATNGRGVARIPIRPMYPGRVRVQVDESAETLGCATARPVVAGPGAGAALTGRS